jgi:lipoyl-dependent peroxiredoxin
MAKRRATAKWHGTVKDGEGSIALGQGGYEGPYSFKSRFEDGNGTNPEELLAAAHAGCFTMSVSTVLTMAGHPPDSLETNANVWLRMGESGPQIPKIELTLRGRVPGITQDEFAEHAKLAERSCPVSKALAGVGEIVLDAQLED